MNEIGRAEGWDRRFLELARFISNWSKDPSTKVGAVIVDEHNRIVSTGFNGLPQGVADTPERYGNRDTKYPMIVHGDANAILFARTSVFGCTMYTYPFPPCARCTGLLIQAGIQSVIAPVPSSDIVSRWGADLEHADTMMEEANRNLYLVDFR